jgi:hypothetical protein
VVKSLIYILDELVKYIFEMVRKGSKSNRSATTLLGSNVNKPPVHIGADHVETSTAHATNQGSSNAGCRVITLFSKDFILARLLLNGKPTSTCKLFS